MNAYCMIVSICYYYYYHHLYCITVLLWQQLPSYRCHQDHPLAGQVTYMRVTWLSYDLGCPSKRDTVSVGFTAPITRVYNCFQ